MRGKQEHYSPPQSGAVKGVTKPEEGEPTEGGSGDKCGEGDLLRPWMKRSCMVQ